LHERTAAPTDQDGILGAFEVVRRVLTEQILHPSQLLLGSWTVGPRVHGSAVLVHHHQRVARTLLGENRHEVDVSGLSCRRGPTDVLLTVLVRPDIVDIRLSHRPRPGATESALVVVEELT